MSETKSQDTREARNNRISRKNFFKYAGASTMAAVAVGVYGCGDDDDDPTGPGNGGSEAVSLGSGDVGILNYAYALEQLEAAFYMEVMDSPYGDMSDEENQILDDLRKHEIAHRDFFQAAITRDAGEDAIIPPLTVNFENIDFSDRTSVLESAKAFEDLGVSAYNGAGKLISSDGIGYLVQAGKIVSVEARHAAAIRDILNPGSVDFAGDDIVDSTTGLRLQLPPAEVLSVASDFIQEEIDASELPSA